jgi:hypothetical protein
MQHGNRKYDSFTLILRSLHWLPVQQRVIFKTLVFVYKTDNNITIISVAGPKL